MSTNSKESTYPARGLETVGDAEPPSPPRQNKKSGASDSLCMDIPSDSDSDSDSDADLRKNHPQTKTGGSYDSLSNTLNDKVKGTESDFNDLINPPGDDSDVELVESIDDTTLSDKSKADAAVLQKDKKLRPKIQTKNRKNSDKEMSTPATRRRSQRQSSAAATRKIREMDQDTDDEMIETGVISSNGVDDDIEAPIGNDTNGIDGDSEDNGDDNDSDDDSDLDTGNKSKTAKRRDSSGINDSKHDTTDPRRLQFSPPLGSKSLETTEDSSKAAKVGESEKNNSMDSSIARSQTQNEPSSSATRGTVDTKPSQSDRMKAGRKQARSSSEENELSHARSIEILENTFEYISDEWDGKTSCVPALMLDCYQRKILAFFDADSSLPKHSLFIKNKNEKIKKSDLAALLKKVCTRDSPTEYLNSLLRESNSSIKVIEFENTEDSKKQHFKLRLGPVQSDHCSDSGYDFEYDKTVRVNHDTNNEHSTGLYSHSIEGGDFTENNLAPTIQDIDQGGPSPSEADPKGKRKVCSTDSSKQERGALLKRVKASSTEEENLRSILQAKSPQQEDIKEDSSELQSTKEELIQSRADLKQVNLEIVEIKKVSNKRQEELKDADCEALKKKIVELQLEQKKTKENEETLQSDCKDAFSKIKLLEEQLRDTKGELSNKTNELENHVIEIKQLKGAIQKSIKHPENQPSQTPDCGCKSSEMELIAFYKKKIKNLEDEVNNLRDKVKLNEEQNELEQKIGRRLK